MRSRVDDGFMSLQLAVGAGGKDSGHDEIKFVAYHMIFES